jgi:predicted small lipoprotein YifL
MKKVLSLTALLVLPFALAGCSHPQPVYAYPPPPAYSQAAQQGYHDGVRAAQADISRGLAQNAERHPRFQNPPVPPPLQEDYRHGFREGYRAVYAHGGPGGGY